MIPILDLRAQYAAIEQEIDAAIKGVLLSGQFILGPAVRELEEKVAAYCGCQYGVGVASGTDALRLTLTALGIGPGDEVITTPFTFIATANTISHCGARPVFVDIDLRTYDLRQGDRETRRQGDFTLSPPLPLSLSQLGGMGSLWWRIVRKRLGLAIARDERRMTNDQQMTNDERPTTNHWSLVVGHWSVRLVTPVA